jgi:hypothetical protein
MISRRASIDWLTKEEGGRSKPPSGIGTPPYSTVVHFVEESWPHAHGSWSLVIEKIEPDSSEYHWIANVRYLMNNAPHDELRVGRMFDLYEGGKRVATGIIIDE